MQDPLTALAIGLSVATNVAEVVGQRSTAKSQKAQNAEARQNAIETRDNDLATIEARRTEEKAAASQKAQQAQQQARQEQSQALAASSQSGQSGLSVSALLSDYLRKSLDNEQVIQTNLSNVNQQLDRERKSVITTAKSRVNQLPVVSTPSFINSALKIGGDAFMTYQTVKPPDKPVPVSKPSQDIIWY